MALFRIEIRDVEIYGHHGVYEKERSEGQLFWIDAFIEINELPPNDDISSTLDYVEVINEISAVNEDEKFHLLETFAKVLVERLFVKFAMIERIEIRVRKRLRLDGAKLKDVAVILKRARTEV